MEGEISSQMCKTKIGWCIARAGPVMDGSGGWKPGKMHVSWVHEKQAENWRTTYNFFLRRVDPVGLAGGIWWMTAAGGSGWAPAVRHWAASVVVRLILEGRVILEEKKKCEAYGSVQLPYRPVAEVCQQQKKENWEFFWAATPQALLSLLYNCLLQKAWCF
jgi:hypothetical protein